jgi:hypothetical protein
MGLAGAAAGGGGGGLGIVTFVGAYFGAGPGYGGEEGCGVGAVYWGCCCCALEGGGGWLVSDMAVEEMGREVGGEGVRDGGGGWKGRGTYRG